MSKELTPLECVEYIRKEAYGNWLDDELDIIKTALKNYEKLNKEYLRVVNEKIELAVKFAKEHRAFEFIKELLHLKVVQLLPNDSDTRLFVECGNYKASILIPPRYIDLLKEVLL